MNNSMNLVNNPSFEIMNVDGSVEIVEVLQEYADGTYMVEITNLKTGTSVSGRTDLQLNVCIMECRTRFELSHTPLYQAMKEDD